MEGLLQVLQASPMPWHLGWRTLESIAPDAVPLLAALFGRFCEENLSLRFDGEDRLIHALRAITPSGQRDVAPSCWEVRLNALRAMRLYDDFELAALDYCVTYGAAPPSCLPARCSLELSIHQPGGSAVTDPQAVTGQGGQEASRDQASGSLLLQGQLMGDSAQALSVLDSAGAADNTLLVSCRDLIRVDFAAVGSLLNWVTLRHAEGKQVQFQDVHRLVAAFFNVIGINERAKVLLRAL
jgi:ABC-type transporter Mla MlaB component